MFAASGDAGGRDTVNRLDTAVAALLQAELDSPTDDEILGLWSELEMVRRKLAAVDHAVINQVASRNIAAAAAAGEIGPAAAAVIVDTIEKLPDEAYRDRTRALSIHPRPDGSARFEGEATVELAEWLRTVCDSLGAPRPAADGTRDPRTTAQRNHDALLEAVKAAARAEQLPARADITTTILLTMNEQTLATGEGLARTGHGALISGQKARSWIDGGTRILPIALNPTGGYSAAPPASPTAYCCAATTTTTFTVGNAS